MSQPLETAAVGRLDSPGRRRLFIVYAGWLLAVLSGCHRSLQKRLSNAIAETCRPAHECRVTLGEVTSFDWDRLDVFSADASLKYLEAVLGVPYPYSRDLGETWIFMRNNRIVYHEDEAFDPEQPPPVHISLASTPGVDGHLALDRTQATFCVRHEPFDSGESYSLSPAEGGRCSPHPPREAPPSTK